jgi:Methylmalonyl Co-A mutase-associated GTPase MeaB
MSRRASAPASSPSLDSSSSTPLSPPRRRAGCSAVVEIGAQAVCLRENCYVTSSGDTEAVLVTGVYGAGKSTVVADIGKLLTDHGERYGLLDVDWLGWFDAGRDAASHRRVVMSNLTTVCEAYLAEGVRRLALAWSIRDRSQLDEVRQAVSVPMRVVRLDVDAELMRRRLLADPTEERQEDDLTVGLEWLAAGHGAGLEDLLVPGDRPVRETSEAICRWLGWI